MSGGLMSLERIGFELALSTNVDTDRLSQFIAFYIAKALLYREIKPLWCNLCLFRQTKQTKWRQIECLQWHQCKLSNAQVVHNFHWCHKHVSIICWSVKSTDPFMTVSSFFQKSTGRTIIVVMVAIQPGPFQ